MAKFYTNKISVAAYLMGPHKVSLISANVDQNNIFKIVLDIEPEEAERLLYKYPTSESRIFDECVKLLKNLLCKKPRNSRRRTRSPMNVQYQIKPEKERQGESDLRRHPGRETGGDDSE